MDMGVATGAILALAALLGAVTALLREIREWRKLGKETTESGS